jgi:RimJ/RimL family protein N-acetyltransferase
MNDQEVCKYNSHGLFPYTKEEEKAWHRKIENNEVVAWAVIGKTSINANNLKPGDELHPGGFWEDARYYVHIGNVSLQSINWINRSAEFAIILGEKSWWGQGVATEALQILINHGFNKLNLHRIWSGTAAENIGMLRVFKKLNMEHEGTFKDGVFLNGQYVNVLCWSILNR